MSEETEKLHQSLLDAYEIIRNQTELICDLTNLVGPLVEAVGSDQVQRPLHQEFLRLQEASAVEAYQSKLETLAVVDAAIHRLKGD